jgi:flagellar motor switch protein FliM
MTDEVLSQAEVESLLTAMESQQVSPQPTAGPATFDAPARPREKITSYDFKRPERVGKEQMRALQSLHEGFGRNFGAALSALLRTIVEVKLTSVDQLTYSEFIFSLENPTCFNLLTAKPLDGNLILDINPSILYPVINRLLGGGKETGPIARRALTEIELRLVRRITGLFLQDLKRAWANIVPLEFEIERVESNPQLVQIVPPNEVVVLISFELTLADVRGMLNLCLPFNSLERISSKLTTNSWATYARVSSTPQSVESVGKRLDRALVEVVATLACSRITTADLLGLRVGDIVTTEHDIRHPLEIAVEGVSKFHASAGALKGHKAIQIIGQADSQ